MARSASGTNSTACGTPVFSEWMVSVPADSATCSLSRKPFGAVRLTVTWSPWKLAVMTPASVSNENAREKPVSRCTKRAKQRAPLPHISPVLPSLL